MSTVGDFVIQRLHDWGVRRIYGYPGDGINGMLGALGRAEDKVRFIQARHEEMAAFMACAHAKFTGQVGVCLATSGPGAIQLLNGLYDAKLDHVGVVAIVGQAKTMSMGSDYIQEVDLVSLFKDVASAYVQMVTHPAAVRHTIDRAVRIAAAERAVTCVILPNDLQEQKAVESPPREHGAVFTGVGYSPPRVVPRDEDLRRAADVLNAGEKVAMLVGAGALHATDEVIATAERLGCGVAKALLGKAAVPDDLPFVTGSIGLLGTQPSDEMMNGCDTLFMIGSSFPYSEFLPKEGQARGVQIDLSPRMLSLRYPMEVNLCGDAVETLRLLLPMLKPKRDRAWRQTIEKNVADWWELLETRAHQDADPINPERLFWELSPRLPDGCILAADSGTSAFWYARDIKVRRGMMGSLSGGLATMCPGVPYAFAAKMCYPDRVAVALVGDGAMQMLGNNGLITVAKYWKEWSDPRLVVIVLNNRDLNMVTWEQRILAGDPKFEASQNLPDFAYARYAELCGLEGIAVDRPEQIGGALDRAFAADRPVVIDARVDPNVPMLPPHVTFDQARKFMASLLKGDTDAPGIVRQTVKAMAAAVLPERRGKPERAEPPRRGGRRKQRREG